MKFNKRFLNIVILAELLIFVSSLSNLMAEVSVSFFFLTLKEKDLLILII